MGFSRHAQDMIKFNRSQQLAARERYDVKKSLYRQNYSVKVFDKERFLGTTLEDNSQRIQKIRNQISAKQRNLNIRTSLAILLILALFYFLN